MNYLNSHFYCYLIFYFIFKCDFLKISRFSAIYFNVRECIKKKGKHNSVPENDFFF